MQNVGDSMLNVNLYQKGHVAKEIFKIVGHQGNNWKKALVPINAHLNASSYLFKVRGICFFISYLQLTVDFDNQGRKVSGGMGGVSQLPQL